MKRIITDTTFNIFTMIWNKAQTRIDFSKAEKNRI